MEGLEQFLTKWERMFRRFANTFDLDVDEVVQEARISFWKSETRWKPGGRANRDTYTITMIRNACVDIRRWRGVRAMASLDELDGGVGAQDIPEARLGPLETMVLLEGVACAI